MIVHSALHSLMPHDGVSEFCLLFQQRCAEMGVENRLYARDIHPSLTHRCLPSSELATAGAASDILIWHYVDSPEVYLAERFPGTRVLFHHNVTPPEFYPPGSAMREMCTLALSRLRSLPAQFSLAIGASSFTHADLRATGFSRCDVFPLFLKMQPMPVAPKQDNAAPARTLVTVCRVVPNKNLEESLAIVAALRKHTPARLQVIGSTNQAPEYRAKLEQLAQQMGLRPGTDLVFLGMLAEHEMQAHLRAADGYLCTSRHEGFCLPLIEAMAIGLPVFAVPRAAIEETMGGAGVLLPADQPAEAAAPIAEVLSQDAARRGILERQEQRLRFFTPENDRARIADLLQTVRELPPLPAPKAERVSVVVCTWNRASHLESCLQALRRQSHDNVEVVVVNGPSTDHTEALLARYSNLVKVVRNPERNLSISRNLGIAAASGDFIAFLDDDAIAHPDWLREALFAFRDPLTGAMGGATYRFTNGETEFANGVLLETGHPLAVQPLPGAYFDGYNGRWNTVRGNNCVFRREALLAVNGFDEQYEYAHEEADIALRLGKAGWRVQHRPLAIVHHSNQPSQNRRSEFDVNWRANLKNTVYCAMKNRPAGRGAFPFLLAVLASNARVRLHDAWEWWLQRRIPFGLFARVAAGCLTGLAEGTWKWLFQKPKPMDTTGLHPPAFLPFPTGQTGTAALAHLSQEVPFRAPTGVGYSTLWLAGALDAHGYRNHVIARGDEHARDARDGCWFHFSPDVLPRAAEDTLCDVPDARRAFARATAAWHRLQELAVRDEVRTVISPLWESEGLIAAMDPRFQVVPVVITPIHEVRRIEERALTGSAAWLSDWEHALLQHAAAIVGISHSSLQDVLAYHQVEEANAQVIPHGLPDPAPTWTPHTPPPPRVLFVGPASRRKGTPTFLKAIPRILAQCPQAEFHVVGTLPQNPQSEEAQWLQEFRRTEPAAAARTYFLGNVSEERKHALHTAARVLAMPSEYESFGIPAAEAQAFGVPVVAANVGGLPEVVAAEETALVIEPGDAQALASACLRLLTDDALWSRFSANARARYLAEFTQAQMGERYAALLHQLRANYQRQQPLLAAALACTLPHSERCLHWQDPLYARNYLVLPKGQPGEWMRLASIPAPQSQRMRIDVFCGVHPRLLPQATLCEWILRGADGQPCWSQTFRAPAMPSAPWGILSAVVALESDTGPYMLELRGAGDVDLRIQRIEIREQPSA